MNINIRSLTVCSALLALTFPVTVSAAPASVTGLEIMPLDDGIELTWDDLDDPSVAHYKVYYSTSSIIDNNGEWEGFEETEGLENSFVFKNFLPGQKLYTGVTAVDSSGNESEWFEEEILFTFIGNPALPSGPELELDAGDTGGTELGDAASDIITLDGGNPAFIPINIDGSLQVIQDEATNDEDADSLFQGTLKLLGARAIAPTRVSLTFSHFISISDQDAPRAFNILDPEGNTLAINTLTIDRADVILETAEQEANRVYQIIVSEPLQGVPNLPLDPISRQIFFRGHTEGLEASVVDVNDSAALFPPDAHDVLMTAEQASDGTYHVETTWKINGFPAGYIIRQTRDGGQTFSPSSRLPADFNGVELDGVTAGPFGLFIQTFGTQGYVSPGVMVSANLPMDNRGKAPITARPSAGPAPMPIPVSNIPSIPTNNVQPTPWPVPADDLSASGAGILTSLGMAGVFASWRRFKRKK